MSPAWQFYFSTLLVYTGVNVIAVWALNLQFGVGGILNFAFIIFQAIGAYVGAVLTIGPASATGGYERYILGATLPWPVPILAAGLAGAILAFLTGLFALRPKRTDHQGMILLTVSLIATTVVTDQVGIFNGYDGIIGVPHPLSSLVNLGLTGFGWFYAGLTAAIALLVYLVVHRLTNSPWGRQLRSIRERPQTAEALGINVAARRLQVFVCGGAIAAVSGAVLVQFIGAWSTSSWTLGETFLYFTCIVVGGLGNNFGVAFGAVLVLTVVINGLQFLPIFSYTSVAEALQFVGIGLAIIFFLWARPSGLFPERRRRFASKPELALVSASGEPDSPPQP